MREESRKKDNIISEYIAWKKAQPTIPQYTTYIKSLIKMATAKWHYKKKQQQQEKQLEKRARKKNAHKLKSERHFTRRTMCDILGYILYSPSRWFNACIYSDGWWRGDAYMQNNLKTKSNRSALCVSAHTRIRRLPKCVSLAHGVYAAWNM